MYAAVAFLAASFLQLFFFFFTELFSISFLSVALFTSCYLFATLRILEVSLSDQFLLALLEQVACMQPATSTRPVCSRQWDPGLYIAGGWP